MKTREISNVEGERWSVFPSQTRSLLRSLVGRVREMKNPLLTFRSDRPFGYFSSTLHLHHWFYLIFGSQGRGSSAVIQTNGWFKVWLLL